MLSNSVLIAGHSTSHSKYPELQGGTSGCNQRKALLGSVVVPGWLPSCRPRDARPFSRQRAMWCLVNRQEISSSSALLGGSQAAPGCAGDWKMAAGASDCSISTHFPCSKNNEKSSFLHRAAKMNYLPGHRRTYLLCLGDMLRNMTRVFRGSRFKSTHLAHVMSPFS